jgi:hypothetical protein
MTRRRLMLLAILLLIAAPLGFPWLGIHASFDASLQAALKGVDRIRVRSGGTCCRDMAKEIVWFEETDPETVRRISSMIRGKTPRWFVAVSCACCGNPSIEFYRGEKLVLTLGYQHGSAIRWREEWTSDITLTPESAAFLNAWSDQHGVETNRTNGL